MSRKSRERRNLNKEFTEEEKLHNDLVAKKMLSLEVPMVGKQDSKEILILKNGKIPLPKNKEELFDLIIEIMDLSWVDREYIKQVILQVAMHHGWNISQDSNTKKFKISMRDIIKF